MSDPYEPIADLYDLAYGDFTDDIEFYENLARGVEGPILELGVGSGRVALPLAEAGHAVVGIDSSASMLARAQRRLAATALKEGGLELIAADMTAFDLKRRFAMIFVAADTFQHLLTIAAQQACLACVTRHLAPGGLFVLSVRSPASVDWAESGPAPLLLDWTRRDPQTGETVMKLIAAESDPARMLRKLTYVYDRLGPDGSVRRSVFTTELRHSTEAELRLLLQHAGLRVTHVYGDYDLSPVGVGENIIVVARAEDPR
jgi:SAM-dependent methyltransferase